jgi:hypothetical protein
LALLCHKGEVACCVQLLKTPTASLGAMHDATTKIKSLPPLTAAASRGGHEGGGAKTCWQNHGGLAPAAQDALLLRAWGSALAKKKLTEISIGKIAKNPEVSHFIFCHL